MDAQNAAESSSTKQLASPREGGSGPDPTKSKSVSSTMPNTLKSSFSHKYSYPSKDYRPDDDAVHELDSDAETIVLPGKDGLSPSKPRKVIKHEDKSDDEMNSIPRPRKPLKERRDPDHNGGRSEDTAPIPSTGKKKRQAEKEKQRSKDVSDVLGSSPPSPSINNRSNNDNASQRRHKSGDAQSESGSETSKSRTPKTAHKEKAKSVDKLPLNKRKSLKTESEDEGETRKARRQRDTVVADAPASVRDREHRALSGRHLDKQSTTKTRSASPPPRIHRRSHSIQLPSHASNGLSKKRRIPAPLHSTEDHSDDSSASCSTHPRSTKLRSVATPINTESVTLPARMPGHKKHVDNHGQTLFAKACAKGEYEIAKRRLAERPDDLNFADYAGNTPLQVASLNGHEDIVQLLIDAGCNLDCRNSDKETPLLDAVENGHLGVVKLLLKAGVNPRKADAEGHEPLEKVPDDLDNAEEIRAALREAKERGGELRRTSEDHQLQDLHDALSSHGPDSPRGSPAATTGIYPEKRRGGTVRSTKTSNHLLYMNLDDKTLRQAAARGDNETVTRVLQVKERCDDPEALVNAARGGHNLVVELLLALGSANPDPRPVPGLHPDYATPILAAIGQENFEVIKLLINANGFNPTRLHQGHTYYEIARHREGPNWKEEEHMLKEAYDQFKKNTKGSSKTKPSPNRRERESDVDSKRATRNEATQEASRSQKRASISPSRDSEPKRRPNNGKANKSPREKRRSLSFGTHDEHTSPKRGPGRPKRQERCSNAVSSDRESSPARSKNTAMPRLVEPEVAASSDGEAIKPRRKLISGKDLKGQREKQRRESLASNMSGIDRGDSKDDESSEKSRGGERLLNRTEALKREESSDRLSTADSSNKRHRSSASPSRRGSGEREDGGTLHKRRKLDSHSADRRHLEPPSPENRHQKRDLSHNAGPQQHISENDYKDGSKATRKESEKSSTDRNPPVTSEDGDVEMRDAFQASEEEGEIQADSDREEIRQLPRRIPTEFPARHESRKRDAERELHERDRKKRKDEARRKEQDADEKRLEAEERSQRERDELKRKETNPVTKAPTRQSNVSAGTASIDPLHETNSDVKYAAAKVPGKQSSLSHSAIAAAEKVRLEEEQHLKEEQERKKQEEEERRRREEQERIQREAEDRARREKEAADEEERREKERRRAELIAREAERKAEEERVRISKLPPLLRWLDGCPDPKQSDIATLFKRAQGVRYDTIEISATNKPGGRDQWLLNTQVALLLGEKDLSLSRFPTWDRVPVSNIAKRVIWRIEQDRYALTDGRLRHLGEQLPGYFGAGSDKVDYPELMKLREEAAKLFMGFSEFFFVRETDFLSIVPTIPHLRDVRIAICYRELPEDESNFKTWAGTSKWKQDPGAHPRYAPGHKYYINGQLVQEDSAVKFMPSKVPAPGNRVPRRHGLTVVTPDEPDYVRLCVEQNLTHLLTEQQKLSLVNGSHLTPSSMASNDPTEENLSPSSVAPPQAHVVNGFGRNHESPERLPNGTPGGSHDEHR